MAKTSKKKYVTITGKNGGKITTSVGSNTYKTLMNNGGSVKSSSSSSSSSSKSSPSSSSATPAQMAQLNQMKQTLLDLQSRVSGGAPTTAAAPVSTGPKNAAEVNAGYAAALAEKNKLNTGQAIPSTALASNLSPQDVLTERARREQLQTNLKSIEDQLLEIQRVSKLPSTQLSTPPKQENPLKDADKYLNNYFTQDQAKTQAELERDKLLGDVSKSTEDFYQNRDVQIEGAYDKYGVATKQEALSGLQKEMADRQVKLRQDIQNLETAPEFRGVSREFAVDQREAIKSKGAFDLSNLAIVESAYNGDLTQARSLAQDLIDNQFDAYTGEMETYKAQLAALMPQLNEDQKKRALAIEVALDEKARAIEDMKADTELKYEYATAVAKLGAPLDVTKSILSATSADEAFMLAAPYMKATTTSTTGGTGTRAPSTSLGQVFSETSPFNTPLSNVDITSSKTTARDLENAVRAQFAPDFSTKLFSVLTGEQLRDFMAKYDMEQRSVTENGPQDFTGPVNSNYKPPYLQSLEGYNPLGGTRYTLSNSQTGPMNLNPEEFLQYYLESIGKKVTSVGGSTSNSEEREP